MRHDFIHEDIQCESGLLMTHVSNFSWALSSRIFVKNFLRRETRITFCSCYTSDCHSLIAGRHMDASFPATQVEYSVLQ